MKVFKLNIIWLDKCNAFCKYRLITSAVDLKLIFFAESCEEGAISVHFIWKEAQRAYTSELFWKHESAEGRVLFHNSFQGLLVLPTSIIKNTSLECTLCQKSICPNHYYNGTPNHYFRWVKKHCTFTSVDECILYFPYIMLIIPSLLFLINQLFTSTSSVSTE